MNATIPGLHAAILAQTWKSNTWREAQVNGVRTRRH